MILEPCFIDIRSQIRHFQKEILPRREGIANIIPQKRGFHVDRLILCIKIQLAHIDPQKIHIHLGRNALLCKRPLGIHIKIDGRFYLLHTGKSYFTGQFGISIAIVTAHLHNINIMQKIAGIFQCDLHKINGG